MWDQGDLAYGAWSGRWIWSLVSLLVAGFVGFLFGDWHAVMMRAAGLSASQSIALRFPEPKADSRSPTARPTHRPVRRPTRR